MPEEHAEGTQHTFVTRHFFALIGALLLAGLAFLATQGIGTWYLGFGLVGLVLAGAMEAKELIANGI